MIAARIEELLGDDVSKVEPLHGGDLSEVLRIRMADDRSVVVKMSPHAIAEAAMLRAIADTGAPTPTVLAEAHGILVLEDLGADSGLARAWGDVGRALDRLHRSTAADYGWPEDYAFGSVPIPNAPTVDWPTFWTERRLLPSCSHIPADLARRVERLAAGLHQRLPPRPIPSLLHGDLWAGNVMADGSRVTGLIDPACYYGHFEVDLAMLRLFGSPGEAFWKNYGDPAPDYAERQPIYQLWPALVHLRLFGSAYRGLVEACLSQAG